MKNLIGTLLVVLFLGLGAQAQSHQVVAANTKVVVVKKVGPKTKVVKRKGHYVWSNKYKKYVWVGTVSKKRNKKRVVVRKW